MEHIRDSHCVDCQAAARAAARLPGTRLGRQERRLLGTLGPPDGTPRALLPDGPGPAAQTSLRRARAKLTDLGLMFVPEFSRNGRTERLRIEAVGVEKVRGVPRIAVGEGWADSGDVRLIHATTSRKGYFKPKVTILLGHRTYFGDEVAQRWAKELATGARLRWDQRRVEAALKAAIERCPHERTEPATRS